MSVFINPLERCINFEIGYKKLFLLVRKHFFYFANKYPSTLIKYNVHVIRVMLSCDNETAAVRCSITHLWVLCFVR